jgi:hypothetical protein
MQQLPILIKAKFYRFLDGTESILEFESWVYQTSMLEGIFSKDDYLCLISIDFSQLDARYRTDQILRGYIDLGEYETWRLKQLLLEFINEDGDEKVFAALSHFYDLYCEGYFFLDSLGLGYGLCGLENWSQLSFEKRNHQYETLLKGAKGEAQKVLSWLESNKITIKASLIEMEHLQITDLRTEEEKQPWYKAFEISNRPQTKSWWKFWSK